MTRPLQPILIALSVAAFVLSGSGRAPAHPIIQNNIDVIIAPDRITVDAQIAAEEVLLIETPGQKPPAAPRWPALAASHAGYVRDHLHLVVDGRPVAAAQFGVANSPGRQQPGDFGPPVGYHLEYAVSRPPGVVTIEQDFLRELTSWSVTCALRERQSTEPAFQQGLLSPLNTAEFDCTWPAATSRGGVPTSGRRGMFIVAASVVLGVALLAVYIRRRRAA